MKNQKFTKVTVLLLTIVLSFTLLSTNVFATANDSVSLTIIHVNDRHGRMDADPFISTLAKEASGNILILDAGDAMHGQITANLTKGMSMVELMNEVGYSAMTLGNHEFTYGLERLKELNDAANFPMLAANVKDSEGNNILGCCSVYEMNGITVGVFGLTTPETITSVDPRSIEGLTFNDPVKTAEAEVAELKQKGCDIIIALVHLGLDDLSDPKDRSDTLATVDGIDVVIDGHSHTALDDGLLVGDTIVAQTGDYGRNIGVVELTISNNKISKTAKLIPIPTEDSIESLAANESTVAKIAELNKSSESVTSVVVGYTPVFMQGEKTESRIGGTNLADLITDSMRWKTDADISFMTGGNIRASIKAGDITMGDVLTTLPYSNLITTVELSGTDVLKILEHGIEFYPEPVGQYLHISGLQFTFDPDAKVGNKILTVRMSDGSSFLPNKTYTVATIDFIAFGGDGYETMLNGKNLKYYGDDAKAFIEYLETDPTITAESEGRSQQDTTHACANDINGHWAAAAIEENHKYGIMEGDEQGSFNPSATLTEEEACNYLSTLFPNADITHSHTNEPLTREQLALMLENFLNNYMPHANDCDENHYADSDKINFEAISAVMCMYDLGIMRGVGGEYFDPKGNVTRAQMAMVLINTMNVKAQ